MRDAGLQAIVPFDFRPKRVDCFVRNDSQPLSSKINIDALVGSLRQLFFLSQCDETLFFCFGNSRSDELNGGSSGEREAN